MVIHILSSFNRLLLQNIPIKWKAVQFKKWSLYVRVKSLLP